MVSYSGVEEVPYPGLSPSSHQEAGPRVLVAFLARVAAGWPSEHFRKGGGLYGEVQGVCQVWSFEGLSPFSLSPSHLCLCPLLSAPASASATAASATAGAGASLARRPAMALSILRSFCLFLDQLCDLISCAPGGGGHM